MELKNKIESLLFVASNPLNNKKIAELIGSKPKETEELLEAYAQELKEADSGVQLQRINNQYQLVSNPDNSEMLQDFVKDETSGELTPAALETLTIVAYRGPVTKVELELIRGVNCSLILRNLLMRGLVDVAEDSEQKVKVYNITFDFLRFLGINRPEELPDYEKLHSNEIIDKLINPEASNQEDEPDKQDVQPESEEVSLEEKITAEELPEE